MSSRSCRLGHMQGSQEPVLAHLTAFARRQTFRAAGAVWEARCHSTLLGHEDWVHSVAWAPHALRPGAERRLLSASMDRTMMVWAHDGDSGVWMCVQSMGDAGAPGAAVLLAVQVHRCQRIAAALSCPTNSRPRLVGVLIA